MRTHGEAWSGDVPAGSLPFGFSLKPHRLMGSLPLTVEERIPVEAGAASTFSPGCCWWER